MQSFKVLTGALVVLAYFAEGQAQTCPAGTAPSTQGCAGFPITPLATGCFPLNGACCCSSTPTAGTTPPTPTGGSTPTTPTGGSTPARGTCPAGKPNDVGAQTSSSCDYTIRAENRSPPNCGKYQTRCCCP